MRAFWVSVLALAAGCSSADNIDSGSQDVTGGDLNARLDTLYSNPANWKRVADKAYGLVGFSTPPCATFMSTALEMLVGVPFPKGLGTTIVPTRFPADLDGDDNIVRQIAPFSNARFEIRTNTSGLTDYLLEREGWQVIWDTAQLKPGDVVMTMPGDPRRHPTHAYMFHGWQDQAEGWGWAIDNEADGHCSEGDDTFVEFCGPNGSGKQLCCMARGQHVYKRSLTKEVPEPYNPKETDDPMWFALRAAP